ncbi:PKD domain-containing protein [Methanocalculus taiwanensis]|uniref:PKD domain-containing protein n=1 Tax=Methanocalculus taiwanensis TaxID=106207 RepID=A0ABD4TJI4_9EURY|nr:PKD domain-containing protein [Methanocalculus taiwanensis]
MNWPSPPPSAQLRKFDGNILCLQTHERAFTPQEILDKYNAGCPPVVNITANVTSGTAPLAVQFNDLTSHSPTAWAWDFGDGGTSTLQNPTHTYLAQGNYTVSLTVTKKDVNNLDANVTGTKIDYITVEGKSFVDFVIDENVFVYGNVLSFSGSGVTGPGATIVITGDLDTASTNLGASIDVTTIYIDGDVTLSGGSAGLGSQSHPGNIYINGNLDLWTGSRNIYGDVYVAGNFRLKDARIHNNVYVDGDLELGWTPWLADDARIYYTGTIIHPASYPADILAKCIPQATVPGFDMPDQEIPPAKPADWYAARGYVSGGALTSNMKVFADSYSSTSWRPTATNVIIIARTGDITITGIGGSGVTGVFFAPNGRVTFGGAFLEGVVIARDGFYVTSGGTQVTFRNIDQYIGDPNDYPF